jgi:hypothetical protein
MRLHFPTLLNRQSRKRRSLIFLYFSRGESPIPKPWRQAACPDRNSWLMISIKRILTHEQNYIKEMQTSSRDGFID